VTAYEWTQVELQCNAPGCYERSTGERGLRPTSGETRAALRKRAAGEGWTYVRSKLGRRYDGSDFCPGHKPGEAATAAGTEAQ
jgi:hypothetical protein